MFLNLISVTGYLYPPPFPMFSFRYYVPKGEFNRLYCHLYGPLLVSVWVIIK